MSNRVRLAATVLFASWCGYAVHAQQMKPDNTGVNTRDRSGQAVTADQQPNTRSDVATTRDIRKAIVADKSLSTYAHNVKVVTLHGHVTLKGPVRTDEERRAVATKAAEVAGGRNVTDHMSVMTARARRRAAK